jgi:alkanesulfonate monooxygenase SsuD/methylene tetrahydromethanopterin reductase-like flavin-dependent oxidoreductase (luciferase family)
LNGRVGYANFLVESGNGSTLGSKLSNQAEAIGFDGIWVSETAHNAFLPLVLVAEHSQRVTLGISSLHLLSSARGF